ncbi:MAG: BCCT family transporter [Gemmatimonadota bacterium]|jgi:choline/glycine/proline betaine transport protein
MRLAKPALRVNPPVFFVSGALLLVFLLVGVVFTDQASRFFPLLLETVSRWGGWLYVGSVAAFLGLALWLLLGPYRDVPLGPDDAVPTFSRTSWFAMLFSAGMGIGLVFYGVAEPVMHYASLPGTGAPGPESAARAVPVTLFHWGFHAWATYLVMGMAIAYFSFRRGLPLAIRSCLHPLLGDRIHGTAGHVVDILAVFGTLFGLATSLGLGAMQISAGLERVFGIPHGVRTQLILIASITVVATVSLVSGVRRGIRRLSELNLLLATSLVVFVLAVGPTRHLLASLGGNVVGYAGEIATRTFAFGLLRGDAAEWSRSWTVFYWGWWIAWAPFVGMFVARISRGRTIGEFVLGVLFVPTAVAVVWFTVFGDTALHLELTEGGISGAVSRDVATAIYVVLERLPLAGLTSALAVAVVGVFFVTSSDSASLVVDMLTSGGRPDPPRWQRVFWATAEGACAAILLYAGGERALTALQAAVVSIGLPFCVVLLGVGVSLVVALRREEGGRA